MAHLRRVGTGLIWWFAHIGGFLISIAIGATIAAEVGGAVAVIAGNALSFDTARRIGTVFGAGLTGLLFGAGIGAIQALLLRRALAAPTRWAVVSAGGWALGMAAGSLARELAGADQTTAWVAIGGALAAGCAGLAQLTVLRAAGPRGPAWVITAALGGALGSVAGQAASPSNAGPLAALLIGWAVEGAVYGLLTGLARPAPLPAAAARAERCGPAAWLFWWMAAAILGTPVAAIGGALLGAAAALTARLIVPYLSESLDVTLITLSCGLLGLAAGTGAGVGWLQWRLLRADLPRSGAWVALTALGWVVGWPLALALGALEAGADLISGGLLGLCIGGAQWLLLRRRRHEAAWWVLAGAAGGAFGMGLGGALDSPAALGANIAAVSAIVKLLGGYGLCTGLALLWLRRRPDPTAAAAPGTRMRMLWLRWATLGAAGWWLGTTLGRAGALAYAETPIFWRPLGVALNALVIGACLALAQLPALRGTRVPWARWLAATVAGWALGLCLAAAAGPALAAQLGGRPDPVFSAAIAALTVGLAQWLALSRSVPHAEWWIIASVAAWSAGALFDALLPQTMIPLMGALSAALTGLALAWLLGRGSPPAPAMSQAD